MRLGSRVVMLLGVATALAAVTARYLPKADIELTPAEQQWLREHDRSIRIAPLPDSPPIDFIDRAGKHRGVTSDYIRLIEQQLDIRFEQIHCESWKELIDKLKNHEVDMVGSVQNTPERQRFLRFTDPYLSIPNVILMRKEASRKHTIDSLAGMSIAIVNGSATHDHLARLHPELRFVPVKSAAEGFDRVSVGEIDAMVADLGVASFYIEKRGISNLRVAGDVDYPWELCLASRQDWPLLNSALGKALANITPKQRRNIRRRWITLDNTAIVPLASHIITIGLILLFALLLSGAVVFRNRALRRQVNHHTHELGRVRQSHQQAARALDKSEERFRALVESSNDMIWEMDRHGTYTYVSPRVRDILGYEPDELVGRSTLSLMVPADSAKNLPRLRAGTADSTIDGEINTFIHKDGRKVILESSGKAFADAGGELAGFRGVSHDITRHVASEAALKASEERFRSLVETTSDWIWEVDQEGRFTYASPQASDILGYAPSELAGKRMMDLMPEMEAAATKTVFRQIVEKGAPIESMVSINLHKDGRTVVLETSAVPFYDTEWNIIGYRGIGRDITDRRLAEEELLNLRNLLSNIINSMPSILAGVDTDGRIMQWNHEAERITGIPAEQAQGQELIAVFPCLGKQMSQVIDAISNHTVQYLRRIPCTLGDDACIVDVTVYPITDDGSEGAVIRMDDVTDRIRIEEMMMQSEKMMSVGGLAAGMAHEINNPLAGILQNLQVMRNRIMQNTERNSAAAAAAGTSIGAIQSYMQERGLLGMMDSGIEAGRRAAKIVDNMLCFSRKDEAHYEPNSLEDILERSVELAANDYNLKKRFDFRHIRIVRDYDDTLAPVPCEKNQIQQVIMNLLSNSAQAMAAHPDPAREPRITLRLRKKAHAALIEVEDNGPGMDDETRKRAFEPFFTTKEVGHGTGLGLSVSYFIITENHGGTMGVDSAPGRGACFSIRLPFKHRQARWGLRL